MDLKKFERLKRRAAEAEHEAAEAAGAAKQLTGELKKQFGCKTLEEAQALREKLAREVRKDDKAFEEKIAEYEREFDRKTELPGEEDL